MTTDLDAEIRLRLWRRRIGNLDIGDELMIDGVTIARSNQTVYFVDGKRIGGRGCSVFTAQLRALEVVMGMPVENLCIVCHLRPRRKHDSYCQVCRQDYQRKYMRARRKRMKGQAA